MNFSNRQIIQGNQKLKAIIKPPNTLAANAIISMIEIFLTSLNKNKPNREEMEQFWVAIKNIIAKSAQ